jgi:hypothetical protein
MEMTGGTGTLFPEGFTGERAREKQSEKQSEKKPEV